MKLRHLFLCARLVIAILAVALVLMAAVSLQPQPALAGFGNSTSHSGSFHSSGSSSHGLSGGSDGSFGGSFDGSSGGPVLPLLLFFGGGSRAAVVLIIVFLVIFALRKLLPRGPGAGQPDSYEDAAPCSIKDNNLDQLKQNDPNFSEANFITRVNNMYLQLQDSWMKKNWNSVRPFETDELFNMHNKQLQSFIDNHTTNMMEEICVLDTKITNYTDDGVNDVLSVVLKARLKDYVIDDTTSKVVEGDPHRDIYMTYLFKMIRKQGVLTKTETEATKVTQCPNCGANVSINASGQCDYCGSVITSGQYDWVLASVEVLDQS
ncbi:MAG: TIM44-like domain-containing protein [Thermacetogeniaceae bacterium]